MMNIEIYYEQYNRPTFDQESLGPTVHKLYRLDLSLSYEILTDMNYTLLLPQWFTNE